MQIPGYDVLQHIVRHGPYVVYRGRRRNDQQPVLLEASERLPRFRRDSWALERQFDVLRGLSVAGIPRAFDLVHDGDQACLVLEDKGFSPLADVLGGRRLDLPQFFSIAVRVCSILDAVHRRQLTHGAVGLR